MLVPTFTATLTLILTFGIVSVFGLSVSTSGDICFKTNYKLLWRPPKTCPLSLLPLRNTIYLMYDVNPSEGFNLRRDVYIRLAVFVSKLQNRHPFTNVRLVLPPFRRLYHWKSHHIAQENLPWHMFFDMDSLKRYAPVLDYPEFLVEYAMFGLDSTGYVQVQHVFQLQQFEDMFENGIFKDKFELGRCKKQEHLHGYLLQQPKLLDNDFLCLKFQGSAGMLEKLLRQTLIDMPDDDVKTFAFLNAEIVLHDHWGDREFWRARRSMRFAAHLEAIANDFRLRHFNSSNVFDKVQRPRNWQLEKPYRGSLGGDYLCVHLRRGDFIYGREKTTPTLKSAATQIRNKMQELNLDRLFLATDATQFEVKNLKSYLQRIKVLRFTTESLQQKNEIKDGGIAIIDQLICAHSQHFIGTYESTFTYRIYEEREILGFPKSSTFNTLCKDEQLVNCSKNSVWPIVY